MAMASWQSQSPTTGAGLNSKLQKKSKVMGDNSCLHLRVHAVDVCGWMDGRKATVEPPAPGPGSLCWTGITLSSVDDGLVCKGDKRLDRPMHGLVPLLN